MMQMRDIFGGTGGQRITSSASGLFLEDTTLCGFCLGSDQKLHYSQIDLNNFYGNRNGEFVSGDRAFGNTAQNLTLSTQNERGKVMLRGQLRAYNYSYRQTEVNLAVCIVNQGGQLAFVHNDGFLGPDGWVASTFESLPYVGFIAAMMQKLAGDEDRFRRAMIHASGSTAVAVLGSIGGYFGGPIGAALVAGAATPLKMMLEQLVGSNIIQDEVVRSQFEEATLGKYIIETITNMIAAGSGKMLVRFFKQQAANIIEALTYSFLQAIGNWAIKKVSKKVNKFFIEKVVEGIVNGTVPYEWLNSTIGPSQLQGNNNNQWNNQNNNQWNNQGNRDRNGNNSNNWDTSGNWIGDPRGPETQNLFGPPDAAQAELNRQRGFNYGEYIPYNPPRDDRVYY
ncbi:hypothetical protein C8R45DRAFT_995083 [Mycena sanguinolenta]|nr:hypothetical protein C8R45DRAFT_995083 [Mycena sanguinolenta]